MSSEIDAVGSMELYGDFYDETIQKCENIIKNQWRENITDGIKGFLFWGEPGIGKTTMAKRVARDLDARVSFQDCADLAMARYGDTETKIREVFQEDVDATHRGRDITIYIFDDAEGLFITRDLPNIEAWYIGHINVLFHEMDQLDTSRQFVIMTTNRKDLLDKALVDRLYPIEFEMPSEKVLEQAARENAREFKIFSEEELDEISEIVRKRNEVETFRDVERIVTEKYVDKLGGSSL
jgi:SpoVK/Ycf46/Vps4 family AAA+-type ATPase